MRNYRKIGTANPSMFMTGQAAASNTSVTIYNIIRLQTESGIEVKKIKVPIKNYSKNALNVIAFYAGGSDWLSTVNNLKSVDGTMLSRKGIRLQDCFLTFGYTNTPFNINDYKADSNLFKTVMSNNRPSFNTENSLMTLHYQPNKYTGQPIEVNELCLTYRCIKDNENFLYDEILYQRFVLSESFILNNINCKIQIETYTEV